MEKIRIHKVLQKSLGTFMAIKSKNKFGTNVDKVLLESYEIIADIMICCSKLNKCRLHNELIQ